MRFDESLSTSDRPARSFEDTGEIKAIADEVRKTLVQEELDKRRRTLPPILTASVLSVAAVGVAVATALYVAFVADDTAGVGPLSPAVLIREGIALLWVAVLVLWVARLAVESRNTVVDKIKEWEDHTKERLTKGLAQGLAQFGDDILDRAEGRVAVHAQAAEAKLGDQTVELGKRMTRLHEETDAKLKDGLESVRREIGQAGRDNQDRLAWIHDLVAAATAQNRHAIDELVESTRAEVTRMLHVEAAWLRSKADEIVASTQAQISDVKEEAFADGYVKGVAHRAATDPPPGGATVLRPVR